MTNANLDHEAWERHERCLALEDQIESGPRFYVPDPVAYSHNANATDSFRTLGSLLANMESRLRSFVDGTAEEQLIGTKRYSEQTRELSVKAAEALGAFKRHAFELSEQYKEKLG